MIDPATQSSPPEVAISWNEQGLEGRPGGGVKLTAANGVAYVCGALPPDPGRD